MNIEVTDFPSDPNSETGKLREELVSVLQKVEQHPGKVALVRSILNCAQKELSAISKAAKATKTDV